MMSQARHPALRLLAFGALAGPAFSAWAAPGFGAALRAQHAESASPGVTGSLRVTVTGPANRKVVGARILIEREAGVSPPIRASVDRDGGYQSAAIEPGRYDVKVQAACYEPAKRAVNVTGGAQAELNIKLVPAKTGSPACNLQGKAGGEGFQFSDSSGLKAGALSGSMDAAGYSSQAQAHSTELQQALREWASAPEKRSGASAAGEADVFARGAALLSEGDERGAQSVFEHGAQRNPRSVKLLVGLAVADYAVGRAQAAVDTLCNAIDSDPQSRAAYFFLAQIYSAAPSRTEAVLERLKNYAAREPQNAAAQYDYALSLWRAEESNQNTGDLERVTTLLQSAIALDPSLLEARFQLAVVLAAQGRDAQAAAEFQKVATMQPDWAEVHYRLSQVYRRTGKNDQAAAELAAFERTRGQNATEAGKLRKDLRQLLLGTDSQ
jgi:tetratricopeptide (TPR) repeat protein